MTGSMLIDGMMAFFSIVLLAAIFVPIYVFLPKWMEAQKARRVALHTAAIAVIDAQLARPQVDAAQIERLTDQRRCNVAALLSLEPHHTLPPEPAAASHRLRTVG